MRELQRLLSLAEPGRLNCLGTRTSSSDESRHKALEGLMKSCLRTMEQEHAEWVITVIMEKEDPRMITYSQGEVDRLTAAMMEVEKEKCMRIAKTIRDEEQNPAIMGCRSCRFSVANRILLMIQDGGTIDGSSSRM